MTHAVVLPGPVVLRDPLPSGWRRCGALGCGAPAGYGGEHVPEAVPPVAVAAAPATLADLISAIDSAQRWLDAVALPCAETALAIDALETAESIARDMRGALCTCTAHGPDLACPDHGAALRALDLGAT